MPAGGHEHDGGEHEGKGLNAHEYWNTVVFFCAA